MNFPQKTAILNSSGDMAEGGNGADIFEASFVGSGNVITDFTVGTDHIRLNEYLFNIAYEKLDIADDADGNAVITVNGNSLTVSGISAADLSADDFLITLHGPVRAHGTAEGEEMEGYAADDALWARDGDDGLYGNAGEDRLGEGAGSDWIFGGGGDDSLYGGAGDDLLSGGFGNDVIYNGPGADTAWGDIGDDTLWGGAGDDWLVGGYGSDTFIFGADTGADFVEDFDVDEDILDLSHALAGFADLAAVTAASTYVENDVETGLRIDLGGGQSVLLQYLTLDDLVNMAIVL